MKFLKERKKEIKFIVICFGIMALICLLFYQPIMSIFDDPQKLRQQLQSLGIFGQFIFAGIMALQVIFVFLPGEIVEIMGGYLYGPIGGLLTCMVGSAIGSSIIYLFVKKFGIRFINKFIGLDKMNEMHFLENKENLNIILFIIFFIPGTPKDILTYFIPLTDMKLKTFLFITTIARIPSIITSTIGGNAIGMQDYVFSMIVFAITGLISIFGIILYKKIIHRHNIPYNL